MAPRPIVAATLQAALLGAVSNILAQLITATRRHQEWAVDWIPVFQFLLFSIVSTPPNFLWQEYLESTFPAHPPPKKKDAPSAKLSVRNTLVKFALDQTLGATVNTLLFSVFIRSLRSAMSSAPRISSFLKAVAYWTGGRAIDFSRVDFSDVLDASVAEFAAIFCAGLKLWPLVSVVNFSLVKTVEGRNLVGALAGVAWGVYMSLVTA